MSLNPSQLTSINERRFIKSTSNSRLLRQRSIRKIIPGQLISKVQQETSKANFNDNEINTQISKEMKLIEQLLKEIKPQLEEIQRKNHQRTIMEILFDLEQKIKRKNNLLTQTNNENKQLKSSNKKIFNGSINSNLQYNNQEEEKTFKLAQELKNQREELVKIKNLHLQKNNNLMQIKNQVFKMEHEYLEKCKKTKEKPVTYEMFKSLNEEKKNQLNNELKNQQRRRNKRQTLQEMLKSNSFHATPTKKNKPQKNLKEIVNRKKIAQQALKTARKKYSQEINQLHAKLQFLREQDLSLVQTLREKEVQFYTLENKFNESRKNYLYNNAKLSKQDLSSQKMQLQKLQNTLRYKGENDYMMDEMRKTRKSTKKLLSSEVI